MIKVFKLIALSILVLVIFVFIFSKYTNHPELAYKAIAVTIDIQQPPDSVFNYLSNSDNARFWSSYVHHISVLNGETHPDGTVGSTRRCFKNADESGIVWDEDITEVIFGRKRQLSIYNAKGFPIMAEGLFTEQIYVPIEDSSTRLTFSLFCKEPPSFLNLIKLHLASFSVQSIFNKNLETIKDYIENGNPSK